MASFDIAMDIYKKYNLDENLLKRLTDMKETSQYIASVMNVEMYLMESKYTSSFCSAFGLFLQPPIFVIGFNKEIFTFNNLSDFLQKYGFLVYHEIGHCLDVRYADYVTSLANKGIGIDSTVDEVQKARNLHIERYADTFAYSLVGYDMSIDTLNRMKDIVEKSIPHINENERIISLNSIKELEERISFIEEYHSRKNEVNIFTMMGI
jgi:hypothetical protein